MRSGVSGGIARGRHGVGFTVALLGTPAASDMHAATWMHDLADYA